MFNTSICYLGMNFASRDEPNFQQETNQICTRRRHKSPTGLDGGGGSRAWGWRQQQQGLRSSAAAAAAGLGVGGGRVWGVGGRAGHGLGVGGGRWDSQVALE
jgi:hypothetical protein